MQLFKCLSHKMVIKLPPRGTDHANVCLLQARYNAVV